MDILELINEATKEADSFEHHPAKDLPLEERLLYLNGLSLVMNADANIDAEEKEYIRILIKSFELDQSCLDDMVAFAQSPDKDTIQSFFRTFRRKPLAQLFLFDAYMMALRDGELHDKQKAVVEKMAQQLEILKGTQRDIFDLFCHIHNKDWKESSLYFSTHLLNPEHFKHLLDYHEVDLEELLAKTVNIRQERLAERVLCGTTLSEIDWMPLEYYTSVSKCEETEVTSQFVDVSFTYQMIVPYIQAMLDRGDLRIFEGKAYSEICGEEVLMLNLEKNSISYDSLTKCCSVPVDLENDNVEFLEKDLIREFLNELSISINLDNICRGLNAKSYNETCFPLSKNGLPLEGEIVQGEDGGFYENRGSKRHIGRYDPAFRLDMSLVDVLTSGRVRFTRKSVSASELSISMMIREKMLRYNPSS